jgi:hypothetical protein
VVKPAAWGEGKTGGKSLAQMVEELARYRIGWRAYFGFAKLLRCCAHT